MWRHRSNLIGCKSEYSSKWLDNPKWVDRGNDGMINLTSIVGGGGIAGVKRDLKEGDSAGNTYWDIFG